MLNLVIKLVKASKRVFWTKMAKRICKSYGSDLKVNYKSCVTRNTVLGTNVNFNGMTIKGGGKCIIGNNFHSGEGAIIQAGSVVCKDIPKYAIAGGHPAVPFSYRDVEHYEKLKQEKKFH